MEHLKDLLNFKENKRYKIIILILFLIVVFLQSRTSLINKQVSILREKVKVLTEEKNKIASLGENSGIYNNGSSNKVKVIKDYTKEKESLINKYKNIALEKGKILNENLTSDNKTLVDETMNLDIIDVNIRSHIDKIKGDSFNIEIEENKISDTAFFRIYLIEE